MPSRRYRETEPLRAAERPGQGVARAWRYYRLKLLRMGGDPKGLALGLALGVFVASLPVLGVQMIAAVVLAWLFRANIAAALIGTLWANPVTTPVLWAGAHVIGSAMLGTDPGLAAGDLVDRLWTVGAGIFPPGRLSLFQAYDLLRPLLTTIFLGSLPLALASALAFYYGCLRLILAYRSGRPSTDDHALDLTLARDLGHEPLDANAR